MLLAQLPGVVQTRDVVQVYAAVHVHAVLEEEIHRTAGIPVNKRIITKKCLQIIFHTRGNVATDVLSTYAVSSRVSRCNSKGFRPKLLASGKRLPTPLLLAALTNDSVVELDTDIVLFPQRLLAGWLGCGFSSIIWLNALI